MARVERKELKGINAESIILKEHKSKSIRKLTTLAGFFTVVINVFSLYLRKLPPPEGLPHWVSNAYTMTVAAVHFLALLLLILIIIIFIVYVIRYGILVLRKL